MAPARLASDRQFNDRGEGYKSSLPGSSNKLHTAISKAAPQSALVLEYLASGRGLSGLIAHTVLGVTSLTTRVSELRKLGLPIIGTWHQDHSNKRFIVYHYDVSGESYDEPIDPHHGTDTWEGEGGPAHPEALSTSKRTHPDY